MDSTSFLAQVGSSSDQSSVWSLEAMASQNTMVLYQDTVNNVTGDWPCIYTVAEGTFIELREALLFNGDAGPINFRLAILKPGETPPTGSTLGQARVIRATTLATGISERWDFATGLPQGWKIYAYTDAGAGVFANLMLSGISVTLLS